MNFHWSRLFLKPWGFIQEEFTKSWFAHSTGKYSYTFVSEYLSQDSFCPYLDSRLRGNNTKTVSLIGVFITNGSTPTRNARNVVVPLNLWAEVRWRYITQQLVPKSGGPTPKTTHSSGDFSVKKKTKNHERQHIHSISKPDTYNRRMTVEVSLYKSVERRTKPFFTDELTACSLIVYFPRRHLRMQLANNLAWRNRHKGDGKSTGRGEGSCIIASSLFERCDERWRPGTHLVCS